jgi:hypothetical protein
LALRRRQAMSKDAKQEYRKRIVDVLKATKFNYWHPEVTKLRSEYLKKFNEHFSWSMMKRLRTRR